MARPLRIFPQPLEVTGWVIVLFSCVVIVLTLVMEVNYYYLLPGAHSPLWLVPGALGLLGGAMLIGSTRP